MTALLPTETVLVSGSVLRDGRRVPDDATIRIATLIKSYLIKLATTPDGWTVLYRDPKDNRHWELSYPQGEQHGGGPAVLTCMSEEAARAKFKL